MKNQKLSVGMKFLIAALVVVFITMATIGIANIFAEPTIEDLAAPYVHEIGTFKPSSMYNDQRDSNQIKVVAWLNTTQIFFSHDCWKDTTGDGKIEPNDVYNQEGFENKMLLDNRLYPIFEIGENNNYYMITLQDYADFNGVVIELQLAENNDLAKMKDTSQYWFDRENNHLYISKEMIQNDIDEEHFNTIRSETIMLVKDVKEMTRKCNIFTVFSTDIQNTHGLENRTPNQTVEKNLYTWSMEGLTYQLVDEKDLAYISRENLEVYVNNEKGDWWTYNNTTGEITLNCSPYTTNEVVVKINKLNDVTPAQQTLQWLQTTEKEIVGQANELSEINSSETMFSEAFAANGIGNNLFLNYLQFDGEAPKVGTHQKMDFTIYAYAYASTSSGDDRAYQWLIPNLTADQKADKSKIKEAVTAAAAKMAIVGDHFQSTTISAFQEYLKHKQAYGNVVYNMFLATKANETDQLDYIANAATSKLLSNVTTKNDWGNSMLTTGWNTWNQAEDAANGDVNNDLGKVYDGRYIVGYNKDSFLGGTRNDDSGYIYFDVTCAEIVAPNKQAADAMADVFGDKNSTDYRTNATIVEVQWLDPQNRSSAEIAANIDGYIYICIWSQTLEDPGLSSSSHHQRILAYSKVPFRYNGKGTANIIKIDPADPTRPIAGATYAIYNDRAKANANYASIDDAKSAAVDIITTSDSPVQSDLAPGTYWIKELKAPTGYELNEQVFEFQIEGGKTSNVTVEDSKQTVEVDLTVYDQDTENYKHRAPVAGVSFYLYDDEGNEIGGPYVSDKNGKVTVSVYATLEEASYRLAQKHSVSNYHMLEELDGRDRIDKGVMYEYCCKDIRFDVTATDSGESIRHTIIHFEPRQTIEIKSHVQDSNVGDNTLWALGGEQTSGSYVTVTGSKYQIRTLTELLLGYKDDAAHTKITIPANTVLVVKSFGTDFSDEVISTRDSADEDAKAYLAAVEVKYEGKSYKLPNGTYQWELLEVSSGYYLPASVAGQINPLNVTSVDAAWKEINDTLEHVLIDGHPTKQYRQSAAIDLIIKSYKDSDKIDLTIGGNKNVPFGNVIKDDAYTTLLKAEIALGNANDKIPTWEKFINKQFTADITSNHTSLSIASKENAVLIKNDVAQMAVTVTGLVPQSVYTLAPLCEIVDINTGETIEAGCRLGYYISDENGIIHITAMGNSEFTNPNESSKNIFPTIPTTNPTSINGTNVSGHALPNGTYGLTYHVLADLHYAEDGLAESVVCEVWWDSATANQETINYNAVTFLYYDPRPSAPEIPTAPDPTSPPSDPPGGPGGSPDGPGDPPGDNPNPPGPSDPPNGNDIPLVDRQWVEDNMNNVTYRVVDSDNLDDNGKFEVSDKLPTTFAFYLMQDMIIPEGMTYTYDMTFYYEVDMDEYLKATDAQKASGEYMQFDRIYARRFSSNAEGLTGGKDLYETIVLNPNSEGFINYRTLKENATISGAIYDTEWLNEQMAAQDDGTYRIFVCVQTSATYEDKFSGDPITIEYEQKAYGTITIKNRELTPLD